jgi:hypothetical protein
VEHDLFGKPVSTFPDHALGLSRRAPANHCRFYGSVRGQASPRAVAPLAKKRNDVRADVIFAKDLQRPIGRRRSLMIEVVDAFLPGDHGEGLPIEQISETDRVMLCESQLGALRSGYPVLSYSRQISSLS